MRKAIGRCAKLVRRDSSGSRAGRASRASGWLARRAAGAAGRARPRRHPGQQARGRRRHAARHVPAAAAVVAADRAPRPRDAAAGAADRAATTPGARTRRPPLQPAVPVAPDEPGDRLGAPIVSTTSSSRSTTTPGRAWPAAAARCSSTWPGRALPRPRAASRSKAPALRRLLARARAAHPDRDRVTTQPGSSAPFTVNARFTIQSRCRPP